MKEEIINNAAGNQQEVSPNETVVEKVKKLEKEEKKIQVIPEVYDAVVVPNAKPADTLFLSADTKGYKTHFTKKFIERKKWVAPDPTKVISHIPGSVVQIFVKPGQTVKAGEKLMIYEAMKMRNVVNAPFAGKIKEVNVKVGEHLSKGALLLVFDKKSITPQKK